ncbi:O-antigen export protein [Bacteroidales bacterium]|nr:O-antigen export protein [Bacteroidales bacterium]
MINKAKVLLYNYFTKGHERTILAKKNILASFAIKVVTILCTFLSYPMTVDYLNPTRSGIWLTLSSVISWIVFFDIGIGNGLKNKFAEAKAKGNWIRAKKLVSSTYAIFGVIVLLISLIFTVLNTQLDWAWVLNVTPEYATELKELVWITFVSFCMLFLLRLITSIVTADQKVALASFIDMLSQVFCLAAVFFLLKMDGEGSLIKFAWFMGLIPVVVYLLASIILFRTRYKNVRPSFQSIELPLCKEMFNLGSKFFVAGISALIMFQTTNVLISKITSPQEVVVYTTALKIFILGYNLLGIIILPYWSAFSDAYALKDFSWMRQTMKKLLLIFIVFVFCQLFILFISDWIYSFWMKDLIKIPYSMSVSVCIYSCMLAWILICFNPLNGIGKMQLQLYSSIFEIVLMIPLAIFMGLQFGAIGIVLSPVLICLPRMIWGPIQLRKILNQTAQGIWNK